MKIRGILKIAAILAVDAGIVYAASRRWEAALIVVGILLLYAAIGENLALLKDRAIRMEKLPPYQRIYIQNAKTALTEDVQNVMGHDISRIRFHMVPDNSTINAYAYGFRNVAVTRALLDCTDNMTLAAVLGHEICHTLALDAVSSRLIFANVMVIMAGLSLGCLIFNAIIWLVLAIPALFTGGYLGIMGASGLSRLLRAITTGMQRILVAIYQALMGIASRRAEFRADAFSKNLGYGTQLAYFLEHFIVPLDSGKATLREILYATHPEPHKRIEKLLESKELQLQNVV